MSLYGKKLKEAFLAGASLVLANKEYINELNVFPVPDGDTGTNMSMTLQSACDLLTSLKDDEVEDVCKAISQGSLRGARGNSGVIMSQILRGFTNYIKEKEELKDLDIFDALVRAKETAYKAVIKPKEGTILTVIKGLSEKAVEVKNLDKDYIEKLEDIVSFGDSVLESTPELLPVLKEAGVVDSGGKGLMFFMHGVLAYLKGEEIDFSKFKEKNASVSNISLDVEKDQDIVFGYCTECMINNTKGFKENAVEEIKKYLGNIGDSLVVVDDETLIKIHVHTNHPGKVFEKGLEYGYLTNLKVDNLRLEHQEKLIKDASKIAKEQKKKQERQKDIGFITVSNGDGLDKIFKDIGFDYIMTGGQTMNPSTDDFVKAIDNVNAKNIFIFPNNSNIIMAAKQAKEIIENKNIYVVETKNIIQAINCMIYYEEKETKEELLEEFNETISKVRCIETTYAVRDTEIDGIKINQNDYISMGDKSMLSSKKDIKESVLCAYEKIKNDEDTVVSIYFGKDIKENEANELKDIFIEKYNNLEVSCFYGGQPVYYYYISIE